MLTFDDEAPIYDGENSLIAHSAIASVSLVHRFGNILLPNLRILDWKVTRVATTLSVLPFISPTLKSFHLTISGQASATSDPARRLIQCLAERTPELEEWHLTTVVPPHHLETAIASCLSTLPKLTKLWLPRFYLTPAIVEACGALARLDTLNTDWDCKQTPDLRGTDLKFSDGVFPVLTDLEFDCPIARAADFFKSTSRFSQLVSISISYLRHDMPAELDRLLTNLAATCSQIQGIGLVLASDRTITPAPIPFATIAKLLPCVELRRLEICHDCPMVVLDADIEGMGAAWREMTHLGLCSDPYTDRAPAGSGTSISLLPKLAVAFPRLRSLGLYCAVDAVPEFDGNLNPVTQFEHLEELDVGTSSVPGAAPAPVAFFLASLLPNDATISYGPTNWSYDGVRSVEDTSAWKAVEDIIVQARRSKLACKT